MLTLSLGALLPYLIFVAGTTGSARVKKSVRCKIFQIERRELHILHFLGVCVVIFGCFALFLGVKIWD